jgi:hypothetical protein
LGKSWIHVDHLFGCISYFFEQLFEETEAFGEQSLV